MLIGCEAFLDCILTFFFRNVAKFSRVGVKVIIVPLVILP